MTEPDAATNNIAERGSTVGMQAGYVHNSTVYQVLPDASPRQKYEVGVRFLEDGVPSRARDLIRDAIAHGYEDGERGRLPGCLRCMTSSSSMPPRSTTAPRPPRRSCAGDGSPG